MSEKLQYIGEAITDFSVLPLRSGRLDLELIDTVLRRAIIGIAWDFNIRDKEDIVQITLLKMYNRANQFKGGSWKSWGLQIAANACRDVLRMSEAKNIHFSDLSGSNKKEPQEFVDEAANTELDTVLDNLENTENGRNIHRSLKALSRADSDILIELYVNEKSSVVLAQERGVSPGTVKSKSFRARNNFRKQYTRMGV